MAELLTLISVTSLQDFLRSTELFFCEELGVLCTVGLLQLTRRHVFVQPPLLVGHATYGTWHC